jgi:SAM-dependent methyltransferase
VTVAVAFDPAAYRAWFDSPLGRRVWADEERALLGVLRPEPGWRVLDVGCGDGRLLESLARRGLRAIGADPAAEMLRAARQRLGRGWAPIHLVRAEIGALPFASESFEAAIAVTVLCFVRDPGRALEDVARSVHRGGHVVVAVLGRRSSWAAERRRRRGSWRLAKFWSAGELKGVLRGAGLLPQRLRGAVFYPRSASAARAFAALETALGAITTIGAAFIAAAASVRSPTPVSA